MNLKKNSRRFFTLSIKNPTPRQIALYSSILVSLLSSIALFMMNWLDTYETHWYTALLVGIIVFISSFLIHSFSLRRYIYRKIKLIYKTIHHLKVAPEVKNARLDLSSNIIEDVEQEVMQWADDQQKEMDQLKSLEEYRRNFLGNISHELKTPIFNIQGYLHTLLDGGLEDEQINMRYLQKAANNVERLHSIVQDLEQISKLESEQIDLELQFFSIKKLASEVFDDLEFIAKEKAITLDFKQDAGQDFKVEGDKDAIRQVLVNLVTNSIKYGKKGGITTISFYDMDSNVLIEVADNGIGIEESHLKRLFERFYRVDKSRSREQGGTGLGLSIVKHILEAHKQSINVRSTLGVGSTFGFTLKKVKG